MVGTVKKSTEPKLWMWFSRNVRQVWAGGFRLRTRYLLTLVSPILMPRLELAMNARRTPARVLPAHEQNQISNLAWDRRPPGLASPDLPCPEDPKRLAMPSHNCFRFHNYEPRSPVCPDAGTPTHDSRSAAYNRGRFFTERSQNTDLVPECNVLQLQSGTVFRRTDAAPARRIASQHDIGSSSARIRCNFHGLSQSEFTRGSMRSFRAVAVGRKCGKFERGGNDRSRCRGLTSSTQNEEVSLRL